MCPSEIDVSERRALYAARDFLTSDVEISAGVRIHFDTFFEDPSVADANAVLGINPEFHVQWEPGLSDGPTSARFAIVDFNADTGALQPPVAWDASQADTPEFRQVHVWALLQHALEFYENGFGLGRSLPWGFEGNRLIVMPAAGLAQNAFYDRASKSLQFYYFPDPKTPGGRAHTSLSADVVRHEFGHAVLDGVRPHYIEAISPQTAGFHEFLGDMTAILIAFRNNAFRAKLAEDTGGDLSANNMLASIAAQFGDEDGDKPYLRTGLNTKKMEDVLHSTSPHFISQVLTGAIYDMLSALVKHYQDERGRTLAQAFWEAISRLQRMAIQPLDLLPPADLRFEDYAHAMMRAEEIANPVDPHNIRQLIFEVFVARGILHAENAEFLLQADYVYDRANLTVFHDIRKVAQSPADAYRFLDDNRQDFLIPPDQDVIIVDLYTCKKLGREAARLPEQICILYTWREDVVLDGPQFGQFDGQLTSMLCGGTLSFDEHGNLQSWMRKPGSELVPTKAGRLSDIATADQAIGTARREELLNDLAVRIAQNEIGQLHGSALGIIADRVPPMRTVEEANQLRFELTPHLGIHADHNEKRGPRQWQISF